MSGSFKIPPPRQFLKSSRCGSPRLPQIAPVWATLYNPRNRTLARTASITNPRNEPILNRTLKRVLKPRSVPIWASLEFDGICQRSTSWPLKYRRTSKKPGSIPAPVAATAYLRRQPNKCNLIPGSERANAEPSSFPTERCDGRNPRMSVRNVVSVLCLTALICCASALLSANDGPLVLKGTVDLPGYTGDFDHFAVDQARGRLLLAAEDHGTVEVFDLNSGNHLRTLTGFETPHSILIRPGAATILVTDSGKGMSKLLD